MADTKFVTCTVHWIDLGSIEWSLISEFGGWGHIRGTWLPKLRWTSEQNWIWFREEGMSFVEREVCILGRQEIIDTYFGEW